jgi:hypothetical protein
LIGPSARHAGSAASAASTARTASAAVESAKGPSTSEVSAGLTSARVPPASAGPPEAADEVAEEAGADREMINHGSYLGIGAGIRQDRSSAWK